MHFHKRFDQSPNESCHKSTFGDSHYSVWIPNVFLAVKFWNCQTLVQSFQLFTFEIWHFTTCKFSWTPIWKWWLKSNKFYLHMLLEGLMLRWVSKIVTKFFKTVVRLLQRITMIKNVCGWMSPHWIFSSSTVQLSKTLLSSVNNNFYKEVNLAICRVESDCSTESALQKQQQTLLRKTQNFCWVMHVRLW